MKPAVFHIVTSLDFGGVETQMRTLAKATHDTAFSHRFVAIGQGGQVEREMRAFGADVMLLGAKPNIPSFEAFYRLVKVIRKLRPVVVHTHGAEANFHGLPAAYMAGVGVRIGEEIGVPSHSRKARLVFRQIYKCANAAVGISSSVADWLVASSEVPKQKVRMIYNPVDFQAERIVTDTDIQRLRLAFIGRLHPVKNPSGLIEAVGLLCQSGLDCDLLIVGDGPQKRELDNLVMTLGIQKNVRFLGYLSSPFAALSGTHLCLQPSVSEGFGIALVEAMGAGLPVIATRVGGAPEIVRHGETGWLIDATRPEIIAAAIRDAWALGPERLQQMGQAARESVIYRFAPHTYVERLEELYKSILPIASARVQLT